MATAKGHLCQEYKNLPLTKINTQQTTSVDKHALIENDYFPSLDSLNTKTHKVIYYIRESKDFFVAYSDFTVHFPYCSRHSYEYLLVVYHYHVNTILVETVKNPMMSSIVKAWQTINNRLHIAGKWIKNGPKISSKHCIKIK